jgi:hypothetical protein
MPEWTWPQLRGTTTSTDGFDDRRQGILGRPSGSQLGGAQ